MAEMIPRLHPVAATPDRHTLLLQGREIDLPISVPFLEPAHANRLIANATFDVYTTSEIDQKLHERTTATTAALNEISKNVDTQLDTLEASLRAEVVHAVNALPQRVLAEEAGKALKDAILMELRQELSQLREDLRAEINALRNE